ncbi:MAG: oligoendopeptidase F, partial [Thermoguttaceae bacterium]
MDSELRKRGDVPVGDTWDLTRLYQTDEDWNRDFDLWKKLTGTIPTYRGRLNNADALYEFLNYEEELDKKGERLGAYVFLKSTEDLANTKYQEMKNAFYLVANRATEELSFFRPELLSLSEEKWEELLSDERL